MSRASRPALYAELAYQPDSRLLFEAVADWPWAVFLDSGRHDVAQSRYDVIAARPYVRLIARGKLTEVHADGLELSREDPFTLLQCHLDIEADTPTTGEIDTHAEHDTLAFTIGGGRETRRTTSSTKRRRW